MKKFWNIVLHLLAYGMLIGAIVLVHYQKIHEPKDTPCQIEGK